ncbi:MAG: hypothetical protein ACFCGT_15035 [Sandaracinaceae bacterium]
MTNTPKRKRPHLGQRLVDKLRELADQLGEALEELVEPQPALVPVPVRGGRRQR